MTRSEWIEGFWKRVFRLGTRRCWLWTGTLNGGYGQLKREDGQTNVYAHRASVEIHTGIRPPDHRVVMHSCDNPRCVNPAHLTVSTQLANVRDMHRKGRANPTTVRGDEHVSSKITEAQVTEIKELWARRKKLRLTQAKLGERYGLSQSQISRILNGKRRK